MDILQLKTPEQGKEYLAWIKEHGVTIGIEAPAGSKTQAIVTYNPNTLLINYHCYPTVRSIPEDLPPILDDAGACVEEWFKSPVRISSLYLPLEYAVMWWESCVSRIDESSLTWEYKGEKKELRGPRSANIESEARLREIGANTL